MKKSTSPYEGQKPGTSGLRKKTVVFQQPRYVENFVQSTFDALGGKAKLSGKTLVVGGDGRFYNDVMIQTIVRMAAGNGYAKVVVGQHGLLSTPAVSCLIREREGGVADGGFILTASHNPGGQKNDCGLKYNMADGGPAPESVTNAIFERTKTIDEYWTIESADVDLGALGITQSAPGFVVEVIDSVEDYLALMKRIFDFDALKRFCARPDFDVVYDGMSGVVGPYATKILGEELGLASGLTNCVPSPDFNGGHPDPNLTYAPDLGAFYSFSSLETSTRAHF